LELLVSPPAPGLPDGQLAGPSPAFHGPREGGGSPVGPTHEDRKHRLTAGWLDGLRFHSTNDQFHVHVGGNVQIDASWLIAPTSASLPPTGRLRGIGGPAATFVRRARLRLEGDIWDQVDYIIEYDFANASNNTTGTNQPPSFGNIAGSPAPINIWMQ